MHTHAQTHLRPAHTPIASTPALARATVASSQTASHPFIHSRSLAYTHDTAITRAHAHPNVSALPNMHITRTSSAHTQSTRNPTAIATTTAPAAERSAAHTQTGSTHTIPVQTAAAQADSSADTAQPVASAAVI